MNDTLNVSAKVKIYFAFGILAIICVLGWFYYQISFSEILRNPIIQSNSVLRSSLEDLIFSIKIIFGICLFVITFIGYPAIIQILKNIYKLQESVTFVSKNVLNVSADISGSSLNLADTANSSSSAIQESVSSMAEMTAMLTQTANYLEDTVDLTRKVMDQSHEGVELMGEMASSMQIITLTSVRLKEIIKVIENIAEKTNIINDVVFKTQLLAVNASIEAARAGHHGKGFAVVANEVASLASLSGKAASEIKDLLNSSSHHVIEIIQETSQAIADGEKSFRKSSDAFEEISKSILLMSEKIDQISEAAKEQEIGVNQTLSAMTQLNQVTSTVNSLAQHNADLSKDMYSYAENLSQIEKKMKDFVDGKI